MGEKQAAGRDSPERRNQPFGIFGKPSGGVFITVLKDGKLLVAGSDKRGTAYGVLELSRMLGVSPWEWWADVVPDKKQEFRIAAGFTKADYPLVLSGHLHQR